MHVRRFIEGEEAAVTVDWVVLAGACVALAIGVTEVTGSAMASLSNDIRAELTNTDPSRNYFDELMNLAVFAEYEAFSAAYGTEWDDDGVNSEGYNWAQAAYDAYATFDDGALMDFYDYHYELATTGDPTTVPEDAQSVDHIAVIERIMDDRGMGTPDGNMSASEVRALYEG